MFTNACCLVDHNDIRVRVMVMIGFSVWFIVSGYAHVFVLFSVVIVRYPFLHRPSLFSPAFFGFFSIGSK